MTDTLEDLDAPSKTPTKDKQPAGDGKADEWKSIAGDKFKSPEELAKGYKEVEKKLGEQSEDIRKGKEFAEVVRPILEEIRRDPEVFDILDKKLRERDNPNKTPNPDDKGKDKAATDDIRTVTSDLILAKFEGKYGIDKLPQEERKVLRQRIGDTLYELTGKTITNLDLRRLESALESAYIIANKDELMDKSKLEALASARANEGASIPGIPSSQGKKEETLTPEEATVAQRLGLTREQYLRGKKTPAKT